MKLTLKQRKNYLIITTTFFIVGFILYGLLGASRENEWIIFSNQNAFLLFIIYGMLGGVLLFGLSSGILCFSNVIRNKKMSIKIMAAVFFPITILIIIYGGILGGIPYEIYNIVQIFKMKKMV